MTMKKADKLIDRYVKEFHADVTRRDVRKEMMRDLGAISMGLDFTRKSDVPTEYVRLVHEEDLTPVQIGFEAWLTATFPGIMSTPPPPARATAVERPLAAIVVQQPPAAVVEQPPAVEPPPVMSAGAREAMDRIAKANEAKLIADAERAEADAVRAEAEAEAAKQLARKAEAVKHTATDLANAAEAKQIEVAERIAAQVAAKEAEAKPLTPAVKTDVAEAAEETAKPTAGAGGATVPVNRKRMRDDDGAFAAFRTLSLEEAPPTIGENVRDRPVEAPPTRPAPAVDPPPTIGENVIDALAPVCSFLLKRFKM
jgi:hypothetical protein